MSDHHGGATSQSSLEKQQTVALKSLIMSNLILSNNWQKMIWCVHCSAILSFAIIVDFFH